MDFIAYMITGHGDDGVNFICFEGIFLEYTTTGGGGHGVGFCCWKNYLARGRGVGELGVLFVRVDARRVTGRL